MTVGGCEVCGSVNFRRLFQKDCYPYQICGHCGLIRIYPQLTDMELDAIYRTGYYDSWGEVEVYRGIKRRHFTRLLNMLPALDDPGKRLLDIGAATGILMEVAKELGYDVYGIEASEDGAAVIAEKFGADHIVNAYYTEQFAGYEPGSFDVICLLDLLEHVRRPAEALRNVFSLLRPGGLLLLYLPDAGSMPRRIFGKYWWYFLPEHLFSFNKQNINLLLQQNEFQVCRIESVPKYLTAEFAANIFNSYKDPIYKIPAALLRLLPKMVSGIPIPMPVGEMAVVAQRNHQSVLHLAYL